MMWALTTVARQWAMTGLCAPAYEILEHLLNGLLGLAVQGGRSLVQQDDGGIL
jgi:hypothetical protein